MDFVLHNSSYKSFYSILLYCTTIFSYKNCIQWRIPLEEYNLLNHLQINFLPLNKHFWFDSQHIKQNFKERFAFKRSIVLYYIN